MRRWVPTVVVSGFLILLLPGCGSGERTNEDEREVVVYTSLDQQFSESILERFEIETGIRVRAVYDTEATKTTGLTNRLLAEKRRPQADVFWNSEVIRTIVLRRRGILAPYRSPAAQDIPASFRDPEGYWTGFAARARVIAVNTDMLPEEDWPRTFEQLAEPAWHGRVAMAFPLFGTTATHVAAVFATQGEEAAREWLQVLASNADVVDGNSTARDRVVAGAVPVAMTDTDDVAVAIRRGDPIAMIFPEPTLLIPNTVALIAGGPNPNEGRALIDYLVSSKVEQMLADAEGAQIPTREALRWPDSLPDRETLHALEVDFNEVADWLDVSASVCAELFAR